MAQAPRRPARRFGEFGGGGGGKRFTPRRKVCRFCADHVSEVDYKDLGRLRQFLSDRGKIEPRRKTGTCAKHQRSVNVALKRARHLALLPFTAEHIRVTGVVIREPGASPRGPRFPRRDADLPAVAEQPAAEAVAAAEGQPTADAPATSAEQPAAGAPTAPAESSAEAPTAAPDETPAEAAPEEAATA